MARRPEHESAAPKGGTPPVTLAGVTTKTEGSTDTRYPLGHERRPSRTYRAPVTLDAYPEHRRERRQAAADADLIDRVARRVVELLAYKRTP